MSIKINRRHFIYFLGVITVLFQLPVAACKRIINADNYQLDEKELMNLNLVLLHLMPDSTNSPGAIQASALSHIKNILRDTSIRKSKRKSIKNGLRWLDQTSLKLFESKFKELDGQKVEIVLRDMETYNKGKRFLSLLLVYTFEALLGDPIYGINTNQQAWKWLNHTPGNPRPTSDNKYQFNE